MDKPIIPSSYLLRVTTIHCQGCGVTNYASEFFAVSRVKPRMGQGAPMKHAIVCDKPLYDLPIEHQSVHRNTAFCMDCNIDLSHLPLPPSMAMLHDLAQTSTQTLVRR
jgi:hypothetical protein